MNGGQRRVQSVRDPGGRGGGTEHRGVAVTRGNWGWGASGGHRRCRGCAHREDRPGVPLRSRNPRGTGIWGGVLGPFGARGVPSPSPFVPPPRFAGGRSRGLRGAFGAGGHGAHPLHRACGAARGGGTRQHCGRGGGAGVGRRWGGAGNGAGRESGAARGRHRDRGGVGDGTGTSMRKELGPVWGGTGTGA